MKLIVGLGNPGKKYEKTRHNAGFMTLDAVAKDLGIEVKTKKFNAIIGEGFVNGEKVLLAKPQTFMNLSGESVIKIVDYYDLDLEDILVIADDLDLALSQIRLRDKGSSGGQKGIQSIINLLDSKEFLRLKIGIGKSDHIPVVDYVLGKMDDETAISRAKDCVLDFAKGKSVMDLMNQYNVKTP